ncbi:MAG TPA: LuxR C-terminal-related transcriptional regulator [Candidatus Dormibacteraeota bacterium]
MLKAARLVTLTGPGGVGKTRLALMAAERSRIRGIRATIIALSELVTAEQVLGAALDAAGVHERPGRDRRKTLVESLRGDVLLVLDNCEHVAVAVAELVETLLRGNPTVRLLATSRRPLDVAGEVTWRTPPLTAPLDDTAAAVVASDAGRLFVARAQRAHERFALSEANAAAVAQICRELDGVPLALELVAARVTGEDVVDLIASLDDRTAATTSQLAGVAPRHATVRASFDWTYSLLSDTERALLRRCSVFAGWTLETAVAVAATAPHECTGMREAVAGLARAGLVRIGSGRSDRYEMPDAVRHFAFEKLAEAGEADALRGRHLDHFCELARHADELLEHQSGRDTLAGEAANLMSAIDHALQQRDLRALDIAAGLGLWWVLEDRFAEGRATCARALSVLAGHDDRREALARCTWAELSFLALDHAEGYTQGTLALTLAETAGDDHALGRCLQVMTGVLSTSDPLRGAAAGRRAVELLRRAQDRHRLAHALIALAAAELQCDRFDAARAACVEFDTLGAGRAYAWLRTWMEFTLAWAAHCEGDEPQALAHSNAAIDLAGTQPTLIRYFAIYCRVHALAHSGQADIALAEGLAALHEACDEGLSAVVPSLHHGVAIAELARGDLEAPRKRIAPYYDQRHLPGASSVQELAATIALANQQPDEAREHAAALRRLSTRTGSERRAGLADLFDGIAEVQRGNLVRAGDLLHTALDTFLEHRLHRDAAQALEAIGALAAAESRPALAARLLGAAAASRRAFGSAPVPPDQRWLASIRSQAEAALGAVEWTQAFAEGEALSETDAAGYAARGRGRRLRPALGWESLTPTEADVARLAVAGLSNPEIGGRLFMSRGTVKAHLAHIYGKLGVANRTELASTAASRGTP